MQSMAGNTSSRPPGAPGPLAPRTATTSSLTRSDSDLSRLRLHRMHRPEADRNPVPGIDHADQRREVDGLGLVEVLAQLVVIGVRRMGLADQGQRLGPGQSRALLVGVER